MNYAIKATNRKISKILVVRLSAFGDVMHVLPALEALHILFPDAQLSWIVEELSGPVLKGHPLLEQVWILPRKTWQKGIKKPKTAIQNLFKAFQFFKKIRREHFSMALDFQGNLRGGIVARLSGADTTVGFSPQNCREFSHLFYSFSAEPVSSKTHRTERNLAIPRFLGFDGEKPVPRLSDFKKERQWAREMVAGFSRPLLLFHPGVSSFGAFKSWTIEGFSQLAEMAAKSFNANVILSWGREDKTVAEQISTKANGKAAIAPECPDLRYLAGLVAEADLVVAPDTGILQLADVLNTPVVALYGPKDPKVYGPQNAPHRIITSNADCSPCKKRSCNDRKCMLNITPEMVLNAIKDLLEKDGHVKR